MVSWRALVAEANQSLEEAATKRQTQAVGAKDPLPSSRRIVKPFPIKIDSKSWCRPFFSSPKWEQMFNQQTNSFNTNTEATLFRPAGVCVLFN